MAYAAGQLDEAARFHQSSLEISRRIGDASGVRAQENNLATILSDRGKSAEALAILEEHLRSARTAGRRADEITASINIAGIYKDLGRIAEARTIYEGVLQQARMSGDRHAEALALNSLGNIHDVVGRATEARTAYEGALTIERVMGSRSGEAKVLGNLAMLASESGHFREAMSQFEKSRKLARECGARQWEASAAVGIGVIHTETGRHADALLAFEQALALYRSMGNPLKEASTRRQIGYIHKATGRDAEALADFEAALKAAVAAGAKQEETWARGALAGAYHDAHKLAESVAQYEQSLELARKLGDRETESKGLSNIALVYYSLGRKAEALAAHEAGLKLDRELGNLRGEAITLLNIGAYFFREKDHERALKMYRESLAIAERIGLVHTQYDAHGNIGLVHHMRQEWDKAIAEYRMAIAAIERVRVNVREGSLKTGFLAQHVSFYYRLADCLEAAGDVNGALAVAEQVKARGLNDLLQAGRVDIRKSLTEGERAEEQRLSSSVTEAALALQAAQGRQVREAAQLKALVQQVSEARTAHEAYRLRLFLAHPQLETQQAAFAPATLQELNRVLFAGQPGLMVVSYLVVHEHVLIYVLTAGDDPAGPARLRIHRVKVDHERLKEEIELFGEGCRQPGPATGPSPLHDWLIGPIEADLADKQHLVIVPDGLLHSVPFQALRGNDKKYLIERCSVSYAPSMTALVKMKALAERRRKARGQDKADLLVVGRPEFGPGLADLPDSEPEARDVAALYGKRAVLLLGRAADRTAVVKALASARYIHIATHGLVNEANPLYSALALSVQKGQDDGLLYARDLIDLDLRAELVVLSACETALGKRVAGEGVLGLTWAVFVAGSPSTMVSQWSVADVSTRMLMTDFHRRLAAGTPKATALREAQLAMLKSKATRHPFHWAPFILVGDWGE